VNSHLRFSDAIPVTNRLHKFLITNHQITVLSIRSFLAEYENETESSGSPTRG